MLFIPNCINILYKAFFNILCTKYMDIAHFVEQVYKRESNRTQQDTK